MQRTCGIHNISPITDFKHLICQHWLLDCQLFHLIIHMSFENMKLNMKSIGNGKWNEYFLKYNLI